MKDAKEVTRDYRKRHPERAEISALITKARLRAAFQVARRHRDEFEAEIQKQCRLLGAPRYLPPISPSEDYRALRHTLEDGKQ